MYTENTISDMLQSNLMIWRNYMSIVIGVCYSNYGLMISDSRMVAIHPNGTFDIDPNPTIKMKRINRHTLIGFAGEATKTSNLVLGLPNKSAYKTNDYLQMILDKKEEFSQTILPVHFLILGRNQENKMSLIELSSTNVFIPKYYVPIGAERAVEVALPFTNPEMVQKYFDKIKFIVAKEPTIDGVKFKLSRVIRELATENSYVDDKIQITDFNFEKGR